MHRRWSSPRGVARILTGALVLAGCNRPNPGFGLGIVSEGTFTGEPGSSSEQSGLTTSPTITSEPEATSDPPVETTVDPSTPFTTTGDTGDETTEDPETSTTEAPPWDGSCAEEEWLTVELKTHDDTYLLFTENQPGAACDALGELSSVPGVEATTWECWNRNLGALTVLELAHTEDLDFGFGQLRSHYLASFEVGALKTMGGMPIPRAAITHVELTATVRRLSDEAVPRLAVYEVYSDNTWEAGAGGLEGGCVQGTATYRCRICPGLDDPMDANQVNNQNTLNCAKWEGDKPPVPEGASFLRIQDVDIAPQLPKPMTVELGPADLGETFFVPAEHQGLILTLDPETGKAGQLEVFSMESEHGGAKLKVHYCPPPDGP